MRGPASSQFFCPVGGGGHDSQPLRDQSWWCQLSLKGNHCFRDTGESLGHLAQPGPRLRSTALANSPRLSALQSGP
jgi:hypothetical protein